MNKESRKNLKRIKKELERLKEAYKDVELRPCHGDAELEQKSADFKMLKNEIYELERDINQLVLLLPE